MNNYYKKQGTSILLRPWLFFFTMIFLLHGIAINGQNSVRGSWSPVYTADMIPVACANLPDGRILSWSALARYDYRGNEGKTYTSIFNPANNRFSTRLVANTGHDMFCPGIANIGNGEVVVTGGSSSNKTSIYNPSNNTWRAAQTMKTRRGYHSMCTLTDGRVFTVGGSWSGQRANKNAEVWSSQSGWVSLANVTSNNTVTQGTGDPEGIYRNDNHAWLWAVPNDRVFQVGPGTNMHWITTTGRGSVTDVGKRGDDSYAMNGTAVMYDRGKILTAGGAKSYGRKTPASNRSYTIDVSGRSVIVNRSGNLKRARTLHNSVVLPNGEVVAIGGSCKSILFSDDCARRVPEIWNPRTGNWREGAAMRTPRNYHSTAILMQDGRIWVAGGGLCGNCSANHPNAEIYTPPYLHKGARPTITSAPRQAGYNSTITVNTNRGVQNFVLMRLSSATHSVNNEQRRIPLNFTRKGGNSYSVNIPGRGWLPPGNYFLFALDDGIPCVAKTIKIGSGSSIGGGTSTAQVVANGNYYIEALSTSQHLSAPNFDNDNVRMMNRGTGNDQKWEIRHQGNNVYTLKNLRNNKFLNVFGGRCQNAANTIIWSNSAERNSRWLISKEGNEYFFRPVHCTSQALDKNNGSNGNVHTWGYSTGNKNQRFKLKPVSGSAAGGGGNNNGVVTLYRDCSYRGAQVSIGVGEYANITNFGNNTLSSIRVQAGYEVRLYDQTNFRGGSIILTADYSCLVQRGFNDKASSIKVSRVSNNAGGGGTITPGNRNRQQINGTFTIRNRASTENIISPSWDNFNVRTFSSGTIYDDHRWVFKHVGGGKHTIRNVGTNRYLEVGYGRCQNGANVNTFTRVDSDHHRWYVEKVGDNFFLLPAHCTTQALNRNNETNPNVLTWNYSTSNKNQQFQLIRSNNGNRIANIDGGGLELFATPTKELQTELSIYIPQGYDKEVDQYSLQYIHEEEELHTDIPFALPTEEGVAEQKFDFLHDTPKIGNTYYRVKIEYVDGSTDYTPYRTVALAANPAPILITPNPVRSVMQLDLSQYGKASIRYFISSITGQIMKEGTIGASHGDVETIDVSAFEKGNYLIYLRPEDHREQVQKFMVLK